MGAGMTAAGPSPSEALRRMMQGYQVSQALYVAATLGIADALVGGSKDVDELAQLAGANASALYRVLRLLASVGVFTEDDARHFTLTELAECLRAGAPGSLRPWILMAGAPSGWLKLGGSADHRQDGRDGVS